MTFDPAVSLRIINNERLRQAQGWAEHRDLGGVLAVISDAPISGLNCLEAFNTTEAKLEGMLDIGFALLRAFDRDPAAQLTPLDRPRSIERHLRRRGLHESSCTHAMVFRGDAGSIPVNAELEVKLAGADEVSAFAQINGGSERWARKLTTASILAGLNEPGNYFYLACAGG